MREKLHVCLLSLAPNKEPDFTSARLFISSCSEQEVLSTYTDGMRVRKVPNYVGTGDMRREMQNFIEIVEKAWLGERMDALVLDVGGQRVLLAASMYCGEDWTEARTASRFLRDSGLAKRVGFE